MKLIAIAFMHEDGLPKIALTDKEEIAEVLIKEVNDEGYVAYVTRDLEVITELE